MAIQNEEIAGAFSELADLLEVDGANPFRVRAYRRAARTVENLGASLSQKVEAAEDLTSVDGLGKDLAAKVVEMVQSGRVAALETLRAKLPADINRMLRLPGLGPKRVRALYHDLGVTTLDELKQAAEEQRVRALPGMGPKLEEQILKAVARQADQAQRFLRAAVQPVAESLTALLQAVPGVERVTVAGSYRRWRDTVGDLDLLVVAEDSSAVMALFVGFEEVAEVLAHGETKSSVALRSGLQVDLRVVAAESYGAALHYFTGSQAHNITMRRRAQKQGLKLNEYGVFRGEDYVAGAKEEDVFAAVELAPIPPELREDRGELEASEQGTLPKLITVEDIRGGLHNHSTASDGRNSIIEMAEAARERGYEYLAITDHSKRLAIANGLDEKRLLRQIEEIDEANERLKGVTLLKGIEADILEDGSLDLSDEVLGQLDLVVGSVHSKFNLSREQQTARICRAMDHPYFTILGHPTGRRLLMREPYEVDIEKVIEQARQRGCFLEVNGNPERLDLHDIYARMAKEAGVVLTINTDAHRTTDLDLLQHGIGQARRAWLECEDVLNTRNLDALRPLLDRTMSR